MVGYSRQLRIALEQKKTHAAAARQRAIAPGAAGREREARPGVGRDSWASRLRRHMSAIIPTPTGTGMSEGAGGASRWRACFIDFSVGQVLRAGDRAGDAGRAGR